MRDIAYVYLPMNNIEISEARRVEIPENIVGKGGK